MQDIYHGLFKVWNVEMLCQVTLFLFTIKEFNYMSHTSTSSAH